MQKTKEVPESIYLLASMARNSALIECPSCKHKMSMTSDVPVSAAFCKAFTLDEAFAKIGKRFPQTNFRNLGALTVSDFISGCELEVSSLQTDDTQASNPVETVELTREQSLAAMISMLEEEGYKITKSKAKK